MCIYIYIYVHIYIYIYMYIHTYTYVIGSRRPTAAGGAGRATSAGQYTIITATNNNSYS